MATTVTRLSANGVYFTSKYFNETDRNINSISLSAVYSKEFDEVTLSRTPGLAKRETSDGKLYITGYFDEVTGIANI